MSTLGPTAPLPPVGVHGVVSTGRLGLGGGCGRGSGVVDPRLQIDVMADVCAVVALLPLDGGGGGGQQGPYL